MLRPLRRSVLPLGDGWGEAATSSSPILSILSIPVNTYPCQPQGGE